MNAHVCKLCGSNAFETKFSYADFNLVRCKACGLGTLDPMPAIESAQFYNEDYYRGTLEEGVGFDVLDEEALVEARTGMLAKIDWLLSKRKVDTFLDIGCGVGLLVEAAAKRGLKARGVDVSGFSIEYGSKELGITGLSAGNFEQAIQEGERFDIVYLNHVIEHVPDPVAFVQSCIPYVASGGWLVLETPDIDSTEAKRDGKDWRFILPEHLFYFNLSALARLCEQQGLRVCQIEKEVGSSGLLHSVCGGEEGARKFYDKWLKGPIAQACVRLARKFYGRVAQNMDVDYKFIKVVAEKE